MTTTRSKRLVSGALVGAGATALTGTLLFTGVSGAHEGAQGADAKVAPATAAATMVDGAQRTLMAADAGTVTVERQGDVLSIVATAPVNGWATTVKRATGHTVKVAFTSDTTAVLVRAHLTDDGRFRYSVSERRDPALERIAFIKAVSAKVEAEKVAADQAAADKAAADQAAADKAAADEKAAADKATAAEVKADDDHDGGCDHDGVDDAGKDDDHDGEFRQTGFGDDDHDSWDHHGGGHGRR
jgi:hypothetical protein